MTNVLGCCKHCGNPMPGLVFETFRKEVDKNQPANPTNKTYVSEVRDKGYRELMDSLGILKDCCRISLMSFYTP